MVNINCKSFLTFRFISFFALLYQKWNKGIGIKGKLCFHPLHTVSTCSIVKPWRSLGCLDPCSSLLVCCFRVWLTHSFVTHVALTAKASDIPDCIHVSQGRPSSLALVFTAEHLGWSKTLSALLIETLLEVSTDDGDKTSVSHILIQTSTNWCVPKQGLRQEEQSRTEAVLFLLDTVQIHLVQNEIKMS